MCGPEDADQDEDPNEDPWEEEEEEASMLSEMKTWDDQTVRLRDRVKSGLGHAGTVVGLVSASLLRVEWDIGVVTLERVSELRLGEAVPEDVLERESGKDNAKM